MQLRRILFQIGLAVLVTFAVGAFSPRPEPVSASHVAAVSAGGQHTCALTSASGIKCWGRNQFGQLGNGEMSDAGSDVPVDVMGLQSGVAVLSSGAVSTCAVSTAGGVKCWGDYHSLGTGGPCCSDSPVPVDVPGLAEGVASVSAGFRAACAVTTAGAVKCWGMGFSPTPADVPGLGSGVAAVAAGFQFACALTTAGGVKCWGVNGFGQLGDGSTLPSTDPVDVVGLTSDVTGLAVGEDFSCALAGGGVKCWGYNDTGSLGTGDFNFYSIPQDVIGLTGGVAAVNAENGLHACALITGGGVKCWGYNFFGQVDGTFGVQSRPVPVDAPFQDGIAAVSPGGYHTCALTNYGAVFCWGGEDYGQSANFVDTDIDGCSDAREQGLDPAQGGARNPFYFWDFTTMWVGGARDSQVDILDVGAAVSRFGTAGNAGDDPLAPPVSQFGYHSSADRSPAIGSNVWNAGPPDGQINIIDLGSVVVQFGHSCV